LAEIYRLAQYWQKYFQHPLVIEFAKAKDARIYINDIKFDFMPWDDETSPAFDSFEYIFKKKIPYPSSFFESPRDFVKNDRRDHSAENHKFMLPFGIILLYLSAESGSL